MQGKKSIIIASAIIIAVLLAILIVMYKPSPKSETEETLILTTFPGLDRDVSYLLKGCNNVKVEPIAPAGVDPHSYSLRPSDIQRVKEASLIISTGHTAFERQIEEMASDKVIDILQIPGVSIENLPGGGENKHMPIYDPDNSLAFASYIASRLTEILPNCSKIIENNLNITTERIQALKKGYSGILNGQKAAAASPLAQYAVEWLGVNITSYIISEHSAQASPQAVEEAEELLKNGGLAIVVVDSSGNPIDKANSLLLELAKNYCAKTIFVEAPFTQNAIIDKIEHVAHEAANPSCPK